MIPNSLAQPTSVLNLALAEVRLGHRVFLLAPGSKEPFSGSKGFFDATNDESEIARRFSMYPNANYGIALDDTDLILDADPRSYPPGRDVLSEIIQTFQLQPTHTVATPGGGYHCYYIKPAGKVIKKKQAMFPGIDFLSKGCYVVGPGSVINGIPYRVVGAINA